MKAGVSQHCSACGLLGTYAASSDLSITARNSKAWADICTQYKVMNFCSGISSMVTAGQLAGKKSGFAI